jgi:ABC-type glycerol-3-phosphate transport system substrate-binding protein
MYSMKRILLILSMLLLAGVLVACGNETGSVTAENVTEADAADNTAIHPTGEKVTIEYWNVNSETFGGPSVERLINEFNASQNRIEVISRFNPDMYRGLMSNLQAEVAAGRYPAVVQVGWALIDYFDSNFPYTDPQTLIDTYSPEDRDFLSNNFLPNMLALAETKDGRQVGLPYAISTPVMFLNRDMLREAGLDESGPQTWEEVDAFARQIRERTGNFGIYIQEPADSWGTQAILESNGARFLSFEDGRVQASFASPEGIEAYTMYADLVKDGVALHISWDEGVNAFAAGEIGMLYTTIARRNTLQNSANFDLTAISSPTWGNKPRRVPAGGCMLAVLAQTDEEKAAAWEFVKFMYSHDSIAEWTIGTGFIPPITRVSEDNTRLREFLAENEMMVPAIQQLAGVVQWAAFPGDAGLRAEEMMIDKRERILGGQQDVEDALIQAQNDINNILR